ncbi:sensor histidine kinase [Bacillus sp. FSL M8-0052]
MSAIKIANEERDDANQLYAARAPVMIWVAITYATTLVLQFISRPLLVHTIIYTCFIAIHIMLYWRMSGRPLQKTWVYIAAQGILVFVSGCIMPDGCPATFIGLYTLLIGQSVGVYYRIGKILLSSLFFLFLFCLGVFWMQGIWNLSLFLLIMLPLVVSVAGYAILFFRQVRARIRTQAFLKDLEVAHQKVEQLTVANERQRMARDLHDTLAQGLVGLIMQLEAVDAHMSSGNYKKSQAIVMQAMERVRETLAEARLAIDNLRLKGAQDADFSGAVDHEVHRFQSATGIPCFVQMKLTGALPGLIVEHGHRIISECLTNIARHAKAKHAWLTIEERNNRLYIEIKDDGTGFDPRMTEKKAGHYGLLGIHERVRVLRGVIDVESRLQEGTTVQIEVPIHKGEYL